MTPHDAERSAAAHSAEGSDAERSAAAHSARARDLLAAEIQAAGGWLSFERFMELALYAPGSGYYSGGAQKLGKDGDFTTAPEISRLFGACVAVQCAEVLRVLRADAVLEIGAGSGRLAVDLLARLETLNQLPDNYWILEVSADLRQRQRERLESRLPHLLHRVRWLDRPPEESFEGVIVANEVLDALPVARFRWHPSTVEELGVEIRGKELTGGEFAWAARPASAAMARVCHELCKAGGAWNEGYASEYCPRLGAWTRAVTQSMRRGAVLWFDYGLPRAQYYLPERHEGTLLCHFRHRLSDDPFANLGLQDITAWVDFTRVAEASKDAGFELAGFTTQAHFLAGLKIDQEMRLAAGADENSFARLANEARQLMMPGEMGERFKAMAWLRGLELPLSGFALLDLRHSL
ncbi:MAG TPA: SAM-dependent methyltransferase [Steroidobacteraceae bacterium]|jgi:SAM-dependent MidA family methyltransferase